ncbi:hypothetical protein [Hydrogenophaga sp. NH-16]|uniref:hypothetical protein n=1 Tax=Hydrogenophaga sp. NH-16 TaxID=2184519 RepID=UPI000FD71E55|nr:hypothetical protein [Hydrogenophaga sp. NH-16]
MVIMVDQPLNRLVVTSSTGSATECVGASFQRCTVDLVNHLRLGSATPEDTMYRLSVWIDEGSAQRELHFFTIAAREFLFPVFRIEIDRAVLFSSPRAAAITSTVAVRGDLMNRADGSLDQAGYVSVCIGNGARMWVRRSAGKPERAGWSRTVAVCR